MARHGGEQAEVDGQVAMRSAKIDANGVERTAQIEATADNDEEEDEKKRLINEAIKRILLDIVIRGHGDRLIGKWSRDEDLQQFLNQVPYLLDRINQLHLACTWNEHLELDHVHHYHHHHQQQHRNHSKQQGHLNASIKEPRNNNYKSTSRVYNQHKPACAVDDNCYPSRESSLIDFVSLIGDNMHWLVRTRDPLGLIPLHKAVLYNNSEIVEYIADRYKNELAASQQATNKERRSSLKLNNGNSDNNNKYSYSTKPPRRLIDAQDKYGRTALHYAAAAVMRDNYPAEVNEFTVNNLRGSTRPHLYHYLISMGADQDIEDFRLKKAAYYLLQPEKLMIRSIIHLDNKLNASFQANVLTKTLRCAQERAIRLREFKLNMLSDSDGELEFKCDDRLDDRSARHKKSIKQGLSTSCNDINHQGKFDDGTQRGCCDSSADDSFQRARSSSNLSNMDKRYKLIKEKELIMKWPNQVAGPFSDDSIIEDDPNSGQLHHHNNHQAATSSAETASIGSSKIHSNGSCLDILKRQQENANTSSSCVDHDKMRQLDLAGKNLIKDRRFTRIVDRKVRRLIINALQGADLNKLNEFLIEGYGEYMSSGELLASSCWNQQCKRYLSQIIPEMLLKVDIVHEAIARNQAETCKQLLQAEPILARIKRPYRRSAKNSLHVAIELERETIIDFLIAKFPELVVSKDSLGATSLHYAARNLRLDRLFCNLIQHYGSKLEHVRDFRGRTPTDYRHQSIRCATIAHLNNNQQRCPDSECDPENELESTTKSELTISGQSLKLNSRPVRTKQSKKTSKEHDSDPIGNLCKRNITAQDQATASVNSSKRLDTTIFECIRSNDTRKLEHLLLANCGHRIEEVYERLKRANRLSEVGVSKLMRDFVENHTPVYRRTIEQVHQTLHACFAHTENDQFDSASDHVQPDIQFLRLNNLFADKQLLMCRDQFGASPLHICLLRADNRLIKYLIWRQPEAVSAPDLEGRNVVHYASIVRAAYEHHGPFKVTTNGPEYVQGDLAPKGYWLIDSDIVDIYTKLCDRYPKLMENCDKLAKTPEDYLQKEQSDLLQGNSSLASHNCDDLISHGQGLIEANHMFGSCCPDYARLLERYSYKIIATSQNNKEIINENDPGDTEDQSGDSDARQRRLSDIKNLHKNISSLESVDIRDGSDQRHITNQNRMLNSNEHGSSANADQISKSNYYNADTQSSASKSKFPSRESDHLGRKTNIGPNNNDSTSQTKSSKSKISRPNKSAQKTAQDFTAILGDNLWVPCEMSNELSDLSKQCVKQVAPKPTVGCDTGYPTFSRSPTTLSGLRCEPSSFQKRRLETESISKKGGMPIVQPELIPNNANLTQEISADHFTDNLVDSGGDALPDGKMCATRMSGYRNSRHTPQGKDVAHHKSVVGGVIVPSIIHDENSGQVETYDIIYRQPSPSSNLSPRTRSPNARGYCSRTPNKTNLLSSPNLNIDNNCKRQSNRIPYTSPIVSLKPKILVDLRRASNNEDSETISNYESDSDEHELTGITDQGDQVDSQLSCNPISQLVTDDHVDSCLDDDDDDDDDDDVDYDQGVERLSNEFDLRVRREKDELRVKVDHIMNEIKLSSRNVHDSGPSFAPRPASSSSMTSETNKKLASRKKTSNMIIVNKDNENRPASSLSTRSLTNSKSSYSTTTTSTRTDTVEHSSCSGTGSGSRLGSSSSSSKTSSSSQMPPSSLRKSTDSQPAINSGSDASSSTSSRANIVSTITVNNNQRSISVNGQDKEQKNQLNINSRRSPSWLKSVSAISKNAYGQTYLHFICSRPQDASHLYKILNHACHLIGERDTFYRTARDVAVQFNLYENVIVIDEFIIDAFISGQTSLLRHLLNQGYSPLIHVSDPDGNDIMLILKLLKLDGTINLLLQMADFQRWRDELHTFIRHGYSAGIHELISKHQDLVSSKSIYSRTGLHLAVLFDRHEMIDVLLKRDPSCIHATDCMGRIALHYAYAFKLPNMAKIRQKLIDAGSNQEARDVKMRLPKYYSVFTDEINEIKRIELELN